MNFEEFKQRQENSRVAENYKMGVVVVLLLSVVTFSAIGKENAKSIIWYWAGFMTVLVITAGILDFQAWRKNKQIGKK